MTIRLATRRSTLAIQQTLMVAAQLRPATGRNVDLVQVTTSGDDDADTPASELTEIGAFVSALQTTVLTGDADAAVHSAKDIPTDNPLELVIAAYPPRATPNDVLVGSTLATLPSGARIGVSSPRRRHQLRLLRSDLHQVEVRGNVDTRLRRLAAGEVDALILAAAGLLRLGLDAEITDWFPIDQMVPAAGQGALAVECRSDSELRDRLASIDHQETRTAVETERLVAARADSDCRSTLGVYCEGDGSQLHLIGFVSDDDGPCHAEARAADPAIAADNLISKLWPTPPNDATQE